MHYETEQSLSAIVRKNLIALVVEYFVTNRIKLGTKDCNILADKIVKLFPTEDKVISALLFPQSTVWQHFFLLYFQSNYFIAGGGKINARGGLYIKYNNQIRLYRCKGLIESTCKRKGKTTELSTEETEQLSEYDVTIEVKREKDSDEYSS